MSTGPTAAMLPDGQRLHLHHGPIDLIIEAFGPEREACYDQAVHRFETILTGLAAELPALRRPASHRQEFRDPVARRMAKAAQHFSDIFVTPMAAVAGAVAEEVLAALIDGRQVKKAYVNNGGDIAFHLTPGQSVNAMGPTGMIRVAYDEPARGLATSGARGRSHSLGIADAVTVAACSAADADIAATLIANAVDLPGHPAIKRAPASALSPDSDLGERLVTVSCGPLLEDEVETALEQGEALACRFCKDGKILQAALSLKGQHKLVMAKTQIATETGVPAHA